MVVHALSIPAPTLGRIRQSPRKRLAAARATGAGQVDEVDVAICGAGPAGLSTALAISKACPDLKVHVYERARKFRPSGGCLGLSTPNIFSAFRALGPNVEDAVKDAGIMRRNFTSGDKHGNNRITRQIESTIIAWYELQKALLSQLSSPDMVSLGCELSEIEEEGDAVTATMASGQRVHAKLLVGADGNASMARRFVQGETQPEYVGAAVWRFFLPGENPFVEVSDTLTLSGDCKLLVMQPVMREGEVLTYCSGISGFDEDRLRTLNQTRYVQGAGEDTQQLQSKLARFAEALDGFQPDLLNYILEKAVPESVLEHPMFSLDPRKDWVRGRVALVGDSAHVMPPNMSQGTPMAVEDAVQLASSLLHHGGITSSALSHYESVRKERVIPIWEESTHQAVQYYKQRHQVEDPMAVNVTEQRARVFESIVDYTPPSFTSEAVV